ITSFYGGHRQGRQGDCVVRLTKLGMIDITRRNLAWRIWWSFTRHWPDVNMRGDAQFISSANVESSHAMIEVEGLTKLYDEFPAVTDLSFSVRPGEVMGLVGPNGAGKTTTLRCLSGIIPATRGQIRIAGEDITAMQI